MNNLDYIDNIYDMNNKILNLLILMLKIRKRYPYLQSDNDLLMIEKKKC
jgi:hypothetical protein